jgi:hypothetical protein
VSTNNNNGLFDKVKKTIASSSSKETVGHDFTPNQVQQNLNNSALPDFLAADLHAGISNVEKIQDIIKAREHELQQQFAIEKQRLAIDLETKFKNLSLREIQANEQRLKLHAQQENDKYQKFLKDKYERIAKSMLQEREQQLLKQLNQEIAKVKDKESELAANFNRQQQVTATELHIQIERLQQDLEQQRKMFSSELESAKTQARKEQESTCRTEFEGILLVNSSNVAKSCEQKFANQLEEKEREWKQEQANKLSKQQETLASDYQLQLSKKLLAQEQELQSKFSAELIRQQSTLLEQQLQAVSSAVTRAIAETTQELRNEFAQQQQQMQLEFEQEKARLLRDTQETRINQEQKLAEFEQQTQEALNAKQTKIEQLEAELELLQAEWQVNSQRLKSEVDVELRVEYTEKFRQYQEDQQEIYERKIAEYKQKADNEYQQMLVEENNQLVLKMERENLTVLKYKELELRENYKLLTTNTQNALQTEHEKTLQATLAHHDGLLAAELDRLKSEFAAKEQNIIAKYADDLNTAIAQERAVLTRQALTEKKDLLQQQQTSLLEQYNLDLNNKLEALAQQMCTDHQAELTALKQQLQLEQQQANLQITAAQQTELAIFEQKLQQDYRLKAHQQNIEHEKAIAKAVAQRERELHRNFELQLIQEQQKLSDTFEMNKQLALQNLERSLREQFNVELERKNNELKYGFERDRLVENGKNSMPINLEIAKQEALLEQEQKFREKMVQEIETVEKQLAQEKHVALDKLQNALQDKFNLDLQQARAEWEYSKLKELQEHERMQQEVLEHEKAAALFKCEQQLRREFQELLVQQRKQEVTLITQQKDQELNHALTEYKKQIMQELQQQNRGELNSAEAELHAEYESKLQQHMEIIRVDLEQEKSKLQIEFAAKFKEALDNRQATIQLEYDRKLVQIEENQEQRLEIHLEQERKKINLKFAQDKAKLVQEISARFMQEKQEAMEKYENELRDTLYKEMVKQKEYIQSKFSAAQDAALLEQKRRLEAQHKHEIERIKSGYFSNAKAELTQNVLSNRPRPAPVVERGVEQLAERILAKFQGKKDN